MKSVSPSRTLSVGTLELSQIVGAAATLIAFLVSCFAAAIWHKTDVTIPSPGYIMAWCACVLLTTLIQGRYVKYIMYFWVAWYAIGCVSLFSTSLLRIGLFGVVSPNVDDYSGIYLLFLAAAIIGALFEEHILARRRSPVRKVPNVYAAPSPIMTMLLLSFPFVYIASVFIVNKSIPILSGGDIIGTMYRESISPLQPYAYVVVVSSLFAFGISFYGRTAGLMRHAWLLVPFFIFVSVADGRRVFGIMAFVGIGMCLYGATLSSRAKTLFAAAVVACLAFYTAGHIARSGSNFSASVLTKQLALTGVEFDVSVYAVSYFSREQVLGAGYDWAASTFASLINGALLEVAGYSKSDLVQRDSARIFMSLFRETLGIRVGLITELWYAFGYWGAALMALLGGFLSSLSRKTLRERSLLTKVILICVLVDFALAIMGQSTVVFGILPTLLYVWVLGKLLNTMWPQHRTA